MISSRIGAEFLTFYVQTCSNNKFQATWMYKRLKTMVSCKRQLLTLSDFYLHFIVIPRLILKMFIFFLAYESNSYLKNIQNILDAWNHRFLVISCSRKTQKCCRIAPRNKTIVHQVGNGFRWGTRITHQPKRYSNIAAAVDTAFATTSPIFTIIAFVLAQNQIWIS